jgi:hypothetical protein
VDGSGEARRAHAQFYPPASVDSHGPDGELPPLLLQIHGGPTSAATPVLSVGVQYWTSRGFAVVDVNYGGSTGYGRAYRQELLGEWGVIDVAEPRRRCAHDSDQLRRRRHLGMQAEHPRGRGRQIRRRGGQELSLQTPGERLVPGEGGRVGHAAIRSGGTDSGDRPGWVENGSMADVYDTAADELRNSRLYVDPAAEAELEAANIPFDDQAVALRTLDGADAPIWVAVLPEDAGGSGNANVLADAVA